MKMDKILRFMSIHTTMDMSHDREVMLIFYLFIKVQRIIVPRC
jgi:hypothetical protein